MDLVFLRQNWKRRTLRHALTSALMGVTPAGDRVYPGRSRPFLTDFTAERFPALAVYAPSENMQSSGQAHRATVTLAIECWVAGRPGLTPGEREVQIEDDLDDLVMAASQALLESPAVWKALGKLPSLTCDYTIAQDVAADRFGACGILIEHSYTKQWPSALNAPTTAPARLQTAHIEMDVVGPAGTITDDESGPDGTAEVVAEVDLTEGP